MHEGGRCGGLSSRVARRPALVVGVSAADPRVACGAEVLPLEEDVRGHRGEIAIERGLEPPDHLQTWEEVPRG